MNKISSYSVDHDGYSSHKPGIFKELGGRKIVYRDKYDEARLTRIFIVAPKNFTEGEAKRTIEAIYFRDCRCGHDCCGHYYGRAQDIKKLRRHKYTFLLVSGYCC